jgi:hypothetical protein
LKGVQGGLKWVLGGFKGVSEGDFESCLKIGICICLKPVLAIDYQNDVTFRFAGFDRVLKEVLGFFKGFQGLFRILTKYRYMHRFEAHFGHRLSKLGHLLCLKQ